MPEFPGQRPPFEPGHDVSVRHGAYARLRLEERAVELVPELAAIVPVYSPADSPAVQLLAFVLARLEAASKALETAKGEELRRLREDARGWANTARGYFNDLGMTPTSRARLKLDVALGERAMTALERHLAEHYGPPSDGEESDS